MIPPAETLIEMYRRMILIRYFDEAAATLFKRGQIKGTVHSYVGQEACAVGACAALRSDDLITSTHRGHGHHLAKGADPKKLLAEIKGKETGYCRGRGGSMHVAAFDIGSLGAYAVVGAGIPIAVGAALSMQMQGLERVVVAFFGDGATNTGNFHESANLASIWNLPVTLFCENNVYAVSTSIKYSAPVDSIACRASSYNMPGTQVDGNDVLAVYQTMQEAVQKARNGKGPTLIEALTYRWEGHYVGEPRVYRTEEEEAEWKKRDPIPRFERWLLQSGKAKENDLAKTRAAVNAEISAAMDFALNSPQPPPETVLDYIYA